MLRKIPFDAVCKDKAACLFLQVCVSSDMVCMGMRVIDRPQGPSVGIKDSLNLLPGILIISAVTQAYLILAGFYDADFCRALYIKTIF